MIIIDNTHRKYEIEGAYNGNIGPGERSQW